MDTTPTPQQICGRCGNWSRLDDDRLPNHGSCKHRPAGHYSHGRQVCLAGSGVNASSTSPVRFQTKLRKKG